MSKYKIALHQLTPEPGNTVFVVSYNGCYLDRSARGWKRNCTSPSARHMMPNSTWIPDRSGRGEGRCWSAKGSRDLIGPDLGRNREPNIAMRCSCAAEKTAVAALHQMLDDDFILPIQCLVCNAVGERSIGSLWASREYLCGSCGRIFSYTEATLAKVLRRVEEIVGRFR